MEQKKVEIKKNKKPQKYSLIIYKQLIMSIKI